MALFPTTIPIGYDTRLNPDAGKRVEKAEDGTVAIINYFSQSVYEGTIVVPWCTVANKAILETFYTTNKNIIWTFENPADGHTYSLFFANEPIYERQETYGDERWKVTIQVVGNR